MQSVCKPQHHITSQLNRMKSAIPGFEVFPSQTPKKIGTNIFPHNKHINPFNKFPAYEPNQTKQTNEAQRFYNPQNFSPV